MNHDEVWDRIPWLVNGRADEAEREQLEAHLRVCEECRIEVAVQRQVMGAIANDKRIDVVPGAAFQRLWDRITSDAIIDDDDENLDAEDRPYTSASHTRASGSAPERDQAPTQQTNESEALAASQSRNRSITRWLAAAVIVEAIGLMALTAALSSRSVDSQPPAVAGNQPAAIANDQPPAIANYQPAAIANDQPAAVANYQPAAVANYQPAAIANYQPAAEYRTVTSPTPQAAAPRGIIRAVFQPTLRVNDLQQLLEQSGLQIVSGPTEAGVYTLASSATEDQAKVDSALTELRSHSSVRFAEPVGK